MPAPPHRTADRHDRPREPGLLPAAGPVPREAEGHPGASGPVWSDTVHAEQRPLQPTRRAEPGWGTKDCVPSASRGSACWRGLSGRPAQPHRVLGEPHQVKADHQPSRCPTASESLPCTRHRLPATTPPGGPQAPGGKVTSPRRPERGRGQTQHSKDGRRCWRQPRLLEPKAWAR